MKQKGYDSESDPTWTTGTNNNSIVRKKKNLSRAAARRKLLLLVKKKRAADKGKVKTTCATRTVEFISPEDIGDERSKLLFVLALGLTPKYENQQQGPKVSLDRLDPVIEAEARARRRKWVLKVIRKRRMQRIRAQLALRQKIIARQKLLSGGGNLKLSQQHAPVALSITKFLSLPRTVHEDDVETVTLTSSDDECRIIEEAKNVVAITARTAMNSEACHRRVNNPHDIVQITPSVTMQPVYYKVNPKPSAAPVRKYLKPEFQHGGRIIRKLRRPLPAILTHKRLLASRKTYAVSKVNVAPEAHRSDQALSSATTTTAEYIIPENLIITID